MIMSIYELHYLQTNYECDMELWYRVIGESLGGKFYPTTSEKSYYF